MPEAPPPFSCRATQVQDAQWVLAFGELDLVSAPALETSLGRALTHGTPVVFDPRGLSFCDLSARRVLETADRQATETGNRFSVLRGSLVLDRLVDLVPDSEWPEFVDPPQGSTPTPPSTASSDEPTLTPAIRLEHAADRDTVTDLRHRAAVLLDAGWRRLSIDLEEAEAIGPKTLARLCCALRELTDRGAQLKIVGLRRNPRVHAIVRLCAIDGLQLGPSAAAGPWSLFDARSVAA